MNYHTPMRFCKSGDNCTFIHVYEYKDKLIPKDLLTRIISENKRRVNLNGIAKHYPVIARKFDSFGTTYS